MKRSLPLFVAVFVFLTAFAIYLSQRAYHRGELMWAFILMIAAVLFWKALQKKKTL
jgi:lipopolysaccharide export LptBFGC system permease protein LptF